MRLRKRRCLALLVLAALLLCSVESFATNGRAQRHARHRRKKEISAGTSTRHLRVNGLDRDYLLCIPKGLSKNSAVPLILAFHGGGGDSDQFAEITNLSKRAGDFGFVVAYPQGFGRSWNAGDCCGPAQRRGVDDVAFVRALLDDLESLFKVDQQRIFATGFSNGDMFSYRLACELSDRIAAIATSSAPLDLPPNVPASPGLPRCIPRRPMPVMHFHGLADAVAPFDGGVSSDPIVGTLPSIPATMKFWVEHNGCTNETQVTFRNRGATCVTHQSCRDGSLVTLCTIEGMGHQWAGGQVIDEPDFGPGTNDIVATNLIVDFFRSHPMPR